MSIGPPIPEIQHFHNLTLKIQCQGQMTMMLHNYRSRQFHRTLNGINPSRGFRDMGSTKSGPSADLTSFWPMGKPIWGQWANNYDVAQLQVQTSPWNFKWGNPSGGFRDKRSAKPGPNLCQIWQVFGPWASPYAAKEQMTMTVHNYRPRKFHRTSNGENPSRSYRDMGSASLAATRPPARTVTTIPLQPGGLRGQKVWQTDVLEKTHMYCDENRWDSSAYSESFKRVECTNWEYCRVRATHQLPVPQTHWCAVSVW